MNYYSLNQRIFELKKIKLETELLVFKNENESNKFDNDSKEIKDLYYIKKIFIYN